MPRDRLYRGTQLKEASTWAKLNLPSQREVAFLHASTTYRMRSRVVVTAIVLLVLLLSIPAGVLVRTFILANVVTSASDDGQGSLRQVIAETSSGSTIKFAASVRGKIMLTSGNLSFTRSLTLRGPGAHSLAISGGKSGHVVHVLPGVTVTISDVSFTNSNLGKLGVGFIWNEGTLTLVNSTISGNTGSTFGGGIFNTGNGKLTLVNSTVFGNSSKTGGGIFNTSTLTLINSTISGNIASGAGGGIYDFAIQTTTITFCTIYDNTANHGGGILLEGGNKDVEARNSIFAGNRASTEPDIAGKLILDGYNLIQNPAHATLVRRDRASTNYIGMSTKVGPLQENGGPTKTHALLQGSLAIDKIPLDACLLKGISTDQRGVIRPQGSACDIGAYEYAPPK